MQTLYTISTNSYFKIIPDKAKALSGFLYMKSLTSSTRN